MALDRIEATFILAPSAGLIEASQATRAYSTLAYRLAELQGGLTYHEATGFWAAGAEQGDYGSPIEVSRAAVFTILMLGDEAPEVITQAKSIITEIVRLYGLPCTEVHVTLARVARECLNVSERSASLADEVWRTESLDSTRVKETAPKP